MSSASPGESVIGPASPPRPADPCTLVIFGALGDLAKRLLFPALAHLAKQRLLPERLAILGVGRAALPVEAFRSRVGEGLREFAGSAGAEAIAWLLDRLSYAAGDFDDPATYRTLDETLRTLERTYDTGGNCLFYLATPPAAFSVIARRLCDMRLTRETPGAWRRLIVEKPFGTDFESARRLNRELLECLAEHQIFRIDHYLGKETVQNIMVLRFANGLFEPLWNREHIDHVQITVAETVSVERRGRFYDSTGALRDMVPNHLFQLLALTAMEPPSCFAADAVRGEKTKLLEAVRRYRPEDVSASVVRAQYDRGAVNDARVPRYREEPDVRADSVTETYVAMRLEIANWRWAGVPFYLRTGKALAARKTEIAIAFKQAPLAIFRDTAIEDLAQNFLVLHIQPDEGITLQYNAKVPSPVMRIGGVSMDMSYRDYFDADPGSGYETLIYDCMIGDATLFQRADTLEAGWRIVQPVLDAWRAARPESVAQYAAGSSGPVQSDELLAREGRRWRDIA